MQNVRAILLGVGRWLLKGKYLTQVPHFLREDINLLIEAIEITYLDYQKIFNIFCTKVTKKKMNFDVIKS